MTPTIHIDKENEQLVLQCSPMMTDIARAIPGMRPNRRTEEWRAPLTALVVDATYSAFRGNIDMHTDVVEYMTYSMNRYDSLLRTQEGYYRENFRRWYPEETEGLWPLQIDGVELLTTARTAYLCDDMGSGKTIQAYRALDVLHNNKKEAYPALVVANKSALVSAWGNEGAKWCRTADSYFVVDGTASVRRKALAAAKAAIDNGENVVVIIGWGCLIEHTRLDAYGSVSLTEKERTPKELNEIDFVTVILDEVHKAKDHSAKRTRAVWQVAHTPSVRNRWGLSGTPVTGYEEDVWGIGHTIQPDHYPRKTQWVDRYVDVRTLPGRDYPIIAGFRPENYDEMLRHLQPYMLRRTKAEIIPNYQGKLPVRTISVEMEPKQRKAYQQMKDMMLTATDDGIAVAPSPIEQLLRLLQFAAAYPVLTEEEGVSQVTGLSLPSCKMDAMIELLEELGDAPAVIFAESKLLIDLAGEVLRSNGISYMRITGDELGAIRAANIADFQAGNVRVALCTYGAGAESITLNRADTVIRLQRSYRFDLDTQAPDRVDRGERMVPVQVIDIVTAGTAEAAVHERVGEKAEIFEQVVRDALRGVIL